MDHDDLIGATLAGKYLIEDRLGSGGMGAVYRCRHVEQGNLVAIKVLRAELCEDIHQLKRFQREAQAASSLSHLNVAQVTDIQQDVEGRAFMVMELVEGRSLKEVFDSEGLLSLERTAALMQQVLSALATAHDAGIVHRDVKPANIMVADLPGHGDLVKLLDFGIAKMLDGAAATKLTKTGVILGTPHYMPSEQVFGRGIDHRVDLYAAGVIIYEALSGKMPFEFKGIRDFVGKITTEEPRSLGEVAPNLPPSVMAVVDRSIASSADDRYQSAREMSTALAGWEQPEVLDLPEGAASTPEIAATPEINPALASTPPRGARPRTKRGVPRGASIIGIAIVCVVLLALAVVTGLLIASWARPSSTVAVGSVSSSTTPGNTGMTESQGGLVEGSLNPNELRKLGIINPGPSPPIPPGLMPKTKYLSGPIVCNGDRRMLIEDVTIEVRETAVIADGSCRLKLRRCVIKGYWGIYISKNARVVAEECWIEGKNYGAYIIGSGVLKVSGGVLKGPGGPNKGAAFVSSKGGLIMKGTVVSGYLKQILLGKITGP